MCRGYGLCNMIRYHNQRDFEKRGRLSSRGMSDRDLYARSWPIIADHRDHCCPASCCPERSRGSPLIIYASALHLGFLATQNSALYIQRIIASLSAVYSHSTVFLAAGPVSSFSIMNPISSAASKTSSRVSSTFACAPPVHRRGPRLTHVPPGRKSV